MTNSQMQVKEVNFQGDSLIGVQTNIGIYTAVNRACECLGLTDGQKRRQVENISNDLVLKQGIANLRILTNGGEQVTLCILIDFLPLWLAKISITPTMKENNPKLVEKLIAYQLKAKDVLAAAFLPQQNKTQASVSGDYTTINSTLQMLQTIQQQLTDCAIQQGHDLLEHEKRIYQSEKLITKQSECLAEVVNDLQECLPTIQSKISDIEKTSRIVLPEVVDRRFKGDEDTLSTDEWEAQLASDLPSKEFAKWANDMVHKVSSKMKLGANCGNIWREAYKGLQLPNGKQISCLTELLDETYVSFRYIFALRLVKTLHQ